MKKLTFLFLFFAAAAGCSTGASDGLEWFGTMKKP